MPDIVPGVPWRWVPTVNHGGPRARTLGVFIHGTRGGAATLEAEYQATVRYCAGANPSQVGPSFVVGPAEVTRMCHDADTCWCQTVDNGAFIGIEVAQPASQPPFVEFQYRACADICARLSLKYGFPVRYLGRQTTPTVQVAGIIGHEDSRAGWERGKTDPGDRWDWEKFIRLVKARVEELQGMTDAEKQRIKEISDHVDAANNGLRAEIAALEHVYGAIPVTTALRASLDELHNWGVHWLRVLGGYS